MTDFSKTDYFEDADVAIDPYPYFDFLLNDRPVWVEPAHGVVMVSGWEEAVEVLRDSDTYSNCNIIAGPVPQFSADPKAAGDDITDFIAAHREELPLPDQIITFDPPTHTAHRALLMGLITPKRLKENEDFIWRLCDRQLDAVLAKDSTEFLDEFAQPYALLVVADLLGVPEEDHAALLQRAGISLLPGMKPAEGVEAAGGHNTLERFYDYFVEHIEDRRRNPRADVLTGMAQATFPDGSVPEPIEVARIASNLFAAGQETTVRLLGTCLQRIGDDPALQQQLRDDRSAIPRFIEETMRIEGPIKGSFRLARKSTTLAGIDVPAGTTVLVLHGATGHDPRQFPNPGELEVLRANARRHLGFGHGIHTCPGAPLARSEVRVCLERLFDRTSEIRVDEDKHGPIDARRYEYMQTFLFRGLTDLHLQFDEIT